MLCKRPFMRGLMPYSCGQCTPCRINRRRLWSSRIMLESTQHAASSFVTLTYNEENEPPGRTLVPKHLADWHKRLRRKLEPLRYRHFSVGEYGEQFARPHYHAVLFGVGVNIEKELAETWTKGFTSVLPLCPELAQYISGYVVKKMTSQEDPRLQGRYPEFSRMSRQNGGIGARAMVDVANALADRVGAEMVCRLGDVPTSLRRGKSGVPLGRYLRQKLRQEMGFEHVGAPPKVIEAQEAEMWSLFEASGLTEAQFRAAKPFVEWTKIGQVENRLQIYSKKGSL